MTRPAALLAAALGYLVGWGTGWAIANVRCGADCAECRWRGHGG